MSRVRGKSGENVQHCSKALVQDCFRVVVLGTTSVFLESTRHTEREKKKRVGVDKRLSMP